VAMKKTVLVLAVGALLAGCAAGGSGTRDIRENDLRKSTHFINDLMLSDMDFPTLQRNLFRHRDACGSAPRFIMDKGETSRGSLIDAAEIPESYENVVLADLIQYPESWRAAKKVAVRVYSYYYNDAVQKRVDWMLGAVRQPGVCTPADAE